MTTAVKKKLVLRSGGYLTDGKRLVRIARIDDDIFVEDAITEAEIRLTHTDLLMGAWKTVELVELSDGA